MRNGDFERGIAGWRASSSVGRALAGSKRAHGGEQAAGLCGSNNCAASLAQTISIPAGTPAARLSFYTYIETEETGRAFDFLSVELRAPGGKALKTLLRLSNADPTDSWRQSVIDLSDYAGREVELIFTATSGKLKPTEFFIDDVSVTVQ